jgi:hypothetical protein
MAGVSEEADLSRFLDAEGRLRTMPARPRVQAAALRYLLGKFDPERAYTEREVNLLLNEWHLFGDPARLRRDMFEAGLLERDRAGREYRVSVR